jgi:hypothetical protein
MASANVMYKVERLHLLMTLESAVENWTVMIGRADESLNPETQKLNLMAKVIG